MNFYIAGMYPTTTYKMHWETVNPAGADPACWYRLPLHDWCNSL